MHKTLADRLLILFVLETSWLLCILRLAGSPLAEVVTPVGWALVLSAGAAGLLVAMAVPLFALRSTPLARALGVVVFVVGLYCTSTASADVGSGPALTCLGLILAVTGLSRRTRPPLPAD